MNKELNTANEIALFKRKRLKELLNSCNGAEILFFHKMYPFTLSKMPEDKIDWAIKQCENTLNKRL